MILYWSTILFICCFYLIYFHHDKINCFFDAHDYEEVRYQKHKMSGDIWMWTGWSSYYQCKHCDKVRKSILN